MSATSEILSDITSTLTAAVPIVNDLAVAFKFADDIFELCNSPTAMALRQRADVQAALAQMDADLKAAQTTGDLTKLQSEVSG